MTRTSILSTNFSLYFLQAWWPFQIFTKSELLKFHEPTENCHPPAQQKLHFSLRITMTKLNCNLLETVSLLSCELSVRVFSFQQQHRPCINSFTSTTYNHIHANQSISPRLEDIMHSRPCDLLSVLQKFTVLQVAICTTMTHISTYHQNDCNLGTRAKTRFKISDLDAVRS